jgi:hypothetical protein
MLAYESLRWLRWNAPPREQKTHFEKNPNEAVSFPLDLQKPWWHRRKQPYPVRHSINTESDFHRAKLPTEETGEAIDHS